MRGLKKKFLAQLAQMYGLENVVKFIVNKCRSCLVDSLCRMLVEWMSETFGHGSPKEAAQAPDFPPHHLRHPRRLSRPPSKSPSTTSILHLEIQEKRANMSGQGHQIRSLYRRFLRELPPRTERASVLRSPSPLQKRIRASLTSSTSTPEAQKIHEAEQFLQYIKAQRMYATLLERYNPGMGMDETERVRLTARRVGMNLPIEVKRS